MPKKQHIPVYTLDRLSGRGLLITHLTQTEQTAVTLNSAHRDSHYIFIFQKAGIYKMMVDFKEVQLEGQVIYCILPGQVHHGIEAKLADAWFVAVNISLIPVHIRNDFEQSWEQLNPINVSGRQFNELNRFMELLAMIYDKSPDDRYDFQIMKSITEALTTLFASIYDDHSSLEQINENRPKLLTRRFKVLLQEHFRSIKSPSSYAAKLNISAAYLNEVVKKTTGMPVSYWIHQQIMMEAKRMLFYTDFTVKEIAFDLGYEDHPYFYRLFSKITGLSPLLFRQQSRV